MAQEQKYFLSTLRHMNNMTQEELGSLCGCSKQRISAIEKKVTPLTERGKIKFAKIFGVEPEQIIAG